MRLLNLGCGNVYHKEWINIDLSYSDDYVTTYDLIKGIPIDDKSIDVVYHSHLLEHFLKKDAEAFIKECHRVLKTGGILRIAVPDLETIAKEYLHNLNRALNNEQGSESDYAWIILEMYDQAVRNYSGGEMAKYFQLEEIPNKEYVFNRFGSEAKNLYESYMNSSDKKSVKENRSGISSGKKYLRKLYSLPKAILKATLFRKEFANLKEESEAVKIGRFRLSGEIHQLMYDRYSLSKMLKENGFKEIKIASAFESSVSDWNRYQLDSINGQVRKPDSLFIEAIK